MYPFSIVVSRLVSPSKLGRPKKMPPKKNSGDDGEGRVSSPAATSEKVRNDTPAGRVSRQEMRDMRMEVVKSLMDNTREMVTSGPWNSLCSAELSAQNRLTDRN